MEHNLRIDKLTAVFNRESLLAQIRFLKRRANQDPLEKPQFALLFIDLDEFKSINDRYGHDAGDQFLITVAARLKTAVRTTDVVARYGGDEFVILLKDAGAFSDVTAAEEKIRSIVEAPMALQQHIVNVGVSIGWAMFPQDGRDADTLMKVADSRMFDSKKRTQGGGALTGCIAPPPHDTTENAARKHLNFTYFREYDEKSAYHP
ncbi:GGDEF domain-containing protein [Undibacterium arcticum]|uniref:GGDEF domain-containing protein n=1 Tax=Undibacterium arcticum TaxID=1762892 RepID=UPI0036127F97